MYYRVASWSVRTCLSPVGPPYSKFGPSISLTTLYTLPGCGAHCARAFQYCAKDILGFWPTYSMLVGLKGPFHGLVSWLLHGEWKAMPLSKQPMSIIHSKPMTFDAMP